MAFVDLTLYPPFFSKWHVQTNYEHGLTCVALCLQWPKRVLDCVGAAVIVTWLLSVKCHNSFGG